MAEPKSKPSSRQIASRFEPDTYERLQRMSRDAGENIAEIVRQLIARALADDGTVELVTTLNAMAAKLAAIEQQLAATLPVVAAIHRRVTGLEQLVCRIDENDLSRRAADHALGWKQWSPIVHEILTLRNGLFATMETAKALQDLDRAHSLEYWADLSEGAKETFYEYRTKLKGECAAIEAETPKPLEPLTVTREEKQSLERLRAVLETSANRERQRTERAASLDHPPIEDGDKEPTSQPGSLNGAAQLSTSQDEGAAS